MACPECVVKDVAHNVIVMVLTTIVLFFIWKMTPLSKFKN